MVSKTQKDEQSSLLLGRFVDLETLVGLLNSAFEHMQYKLEPVKGQEGMYLFIEDEIRADEYECGLVEKIGDKAYAFSQAVHDMIMSAYDRYEAEQV